MIYDAQCGTESHAYDAIDFDFQCGDEGFNWRSWISPFIGGDGGAYYAWFLQTAVGVLINEPYAFDLTLYISCYNTVYLLTK